ncbi:hypothetical protein ACVIHI_000326 [Bradyrhizobium sp. USDA 4524]
MLQMDLHVPHASLYGDKWIPLLPRSVAKVVDAIRRRSGDAALAAHAVLVRSPEIAKVAVLPGAPDATGEILLFLNDVAGAYWFIWAAFVCFLLVKILSIFDRCSPLTLFVSVVLVVLAPLTFSIFHLIKYTYPFFCLGFSAAQSRDWWASNAILQAALDRDSVHSGAGMFSSLAQRHLRLQQSRPGPRYAVGEECASDVFRLCRGFGAHD